MSRRFLSRECSLDTEQPMQEGMIGNGVPAEKIYLVNAGFSLQTKNNFEKRRAMLPKRPRQEGEEEMIIGPVVTSLCEAVRLASFLLAHY